MIFLSYKTLFSAKAGNLFDRENLRWSTRNLKEIENSVTLYIVANIVQEEEKTSENARKCERQEIPKKNGSLQTDSSEQSEGDTHVDDMSNQREGSVLPSAPLSSVHTRSVPVTCCETWNKGHVIAINELLP